MTKVYSYIRFSTDKQADGSSIARQQDYAEKWAANNGYTLDASLTMRDEGLSAFHQKHISQGALGVFLRAIEDGLIEKGSFLVVESLDRLSRAEPMIAQAQMASIIQHGISIVTAGDGKVYSRASIKASGGMELITSLIIMIRANEESETKSKRVSDAIRRRCIGWQDGTYRGLVSYGMIPSWLEVIDGKWHLRKDRAKAIRLAIKMYMNGSSLSQIVSEFGETGLRPSAAEPTTSHLSKVLPQIALVGNKEIQLDGITYLLEGYYPPLIDMKTWNELQKELKSRGRVTVKTRIPSILTGFGVTHCGYCGNSLKSHINTSKIQDDGTIADCNRRLQCASANALTKCPVSGSCSSGPIERMIFEFCSDIMNLRSFFPRDHSLIPRTELAQAEKHLAGIDKKLARITEALLLSDDAPKSFVKAAHDLEIEREIALKNVSEAMNAVKDATSIDISGKDIEWKQIAKGVDSLNIKAREKAIKLVKDTFSEITVFHKSTDPYETPNFIDVVLHPKGGNPRSFRIDKKGGWVAQEEQALLQ